MYNALWIPPAKHFAKLFISLDFMHVDGCWYIVYTQFRRQVGGNRGSLPQASSVRGPPNSARLVQIRSSSSVTFQSSFFKGFVSLYFRLKSAYFFCFGFYAAGATSDSMHNYLRSPLARALYIILFNLKPLIEDGNLQVYMYCVHAWKRTSGAPRTHFRTCKISKFLGGMPPDPLAQSILWDPTFGIWPWAPQSYRQPWMFY